MRQRTRQSLGLLAVAALVAAACGGDDDSGAATTAAPETTIATTEEPDEQPDDEPGEQPEDEPGEQPDDEPAEEPVEEPAQEFGEPEVSGLVFSGVSPNAGNWAIQIGVEEGIFEEYGMPTEMIFSASSPAALAALMAGSVQFTSTVYDTGIQAFLQNDDVIYVAGGYDTFPQELIVTPDIESVEELRGATCGAANPPGTGDHLYTQLMITGLSGGTMEIDEDYEIITVGAQVPAIAAAFEAGVIQCYITLPPAVGLLEDIGYKSLANTADSPEFENYAFFGINVLRSWAESNPNSIHAFLRGYLASIAWLYDPANQERAVEILATNAGLEPEVANAAYGWVDRGGYPRTGVMKPEFIHRVIEVQQQFGSLQLLTRDIAPEIQDNSYVQTAYDSLPDSVKDGPGPGR